MTSPSEAPSQKTSLKIADIEALGFTFDTDPHASSNAHLARNFYFIKAECGGMPAMRLNLFPDLGRGNQEWCIEIYGGISATTDLRTLISNGVSPGDILRKERVSFEDVLAAMERLINEAITEVKNPSEIISRCMNCRREVSELLKYCGLADCDEVASKSSMNPTIR